MLGFASKCQNESHKLESKNDQTLVESTENLGTHDCIKQVARAVLFIVKDQRFYYSAVIILNCCSSNRVYSQRVIILLHHKTAF
jgi:hypothetical protein